MRRPTRIQPCERRRGLAESEPERVRAVGFDPVDPQGRRSVGENRNRVGEGAEADLRPRRRVAAALEVVTTRHERERQRDADGRLLVVQTFEDVQDRRDQHEHDRQLPCAASPSPKTSREHDQRQSSGDDQCACEARDGIRSDAFDQLYSIGELRRHGRGDVEDSSDSDECSEDERRAPRGLRVSSPQQGAPQPDQTGSEVERRHVDGCMEGLPVGDLAHDHERDPRGEKEPEPCRQGRQQRRRQTFNARSPRQ